MVVNIERRQYFKSCGRVRISFSDLVDKLEKIGADLNCEITAINGKHEFTSLQDIKSHEGLFVGFPEVYIGDLTVNFSKTGVKLSLVAVDDLDGKFILSVDSFFEILKGYRNWSSVILTARLTQILVSFAITCGFFFYPVAGFSTMDRLMFKNEFSFIGFGFVTALIGSTFLFSWFERSPCVYISNGKVGFLNRNYDKLVTSSIMLIVGAIVGLLIERLL